MKNTSENSIIKTLSKGKEFIKYNLYSYETYTSIKDHVIGLYSWHIMPPLADPESVRNYHNLFGNKYYKAKIDSDFGESYEGELQYEGNQKIIDKINEIEFNSSDDNQILFRIVSLLFSPPLYIGRSNDLKDRLNDHYEELNILLGKSSDLEYDREYYEDNTKEESKNFARRIKKYLSENHDQNYEITNFYVKVIYLDSDSTLDYNHIEELEYYINRTFKPIIGKL